MEPKLGEDLDKTKTDIQQYPTPEQQRDIIKKVENDKTTYSYFVCKSWYHQWKTHVNYDDLGILDLENVITGQPDVTEIHVLTRKGTCRRGPGLAVAAGQNGVTTARQGDEDITTRTDNQKANGIDDGRAKGNHVPDTVNSTNEVAEWENTDDQAAILASSTPVKPFSHKVSTMMKKKPKLMRVCRNSSKTEIDSSFEESVEISNSADRTKPINPILAGLKAEGRKEGEKPDANASMTEIFEQVRTRLHQASESTLRQLCDATGDTTLIENIVVAPEVVSIPIWSNSIVFNENRIAIVIAEVSQH